MWGIIHTDKLCTQAEGNMTMKMELVIAGAVILLAFVSWLKIDNTIEELYKKSRPGPDYVDHEESPMWEVVP